ncbi:uncharacterized protein LOC107273552 [Cephus cinctus]|uniref:Uncharacterized protein LOC107273552 n=1 Tax=Cephus cinctus TaxID=211228 RepID=A0AAJ7CCG2_CEPCN|nr:uncharacterized protein LOC107273552 [Cephus cinctus]
MGSSFKSIIGTVRRYFVVVIFPTTAIGLIYADYMHTRDWKKSQLQKEQQNAVTA